MITGSVNANLEAIIQVVVGNADSEQRQVEAVIDTGFSGYLTLPPALIALLHLAWLGREPGILADGSVDLFDVYRASVMWEGQMRLIEIQDVNAEPLAGMALLQGHSLQIAVVTGGAVIIAALP